MLSLLECLQYTLINFRLRLKKSGIGCHIHGKYMGSLGYVDDVTLLSPSIRCLNRMLSICEEFGKEYFIKFQQQEINVHKIW